MNNQGLNITNTVITPVRASVRGGPGGWNVQISATYDGKTIEVSVTEPRYIPVFNTDGVRNAAEAHRKAEEYLYQLLPST